MYLRLLYCIIITCFFIFVISAPHEDITGLTTHSNFSVYISNGGMTSKWTQYSIYIYINNVSKLVYSIGAVMKRKSLKRNFHHFVQFECDDLLRRDCFLLVFPQGFHLSQQGWYYHFPFPFFFNHLLWIWKRWVMRLNDTWNDSVRAQQQERTWASDRWLQPTRSLWKGLHSPDLIKAQSLLTCFNKQAEWARGDLHCLA